MVNLQSRTANSPSGISIMGGDWKTESLSELPRIEKSREIIKIFLFYMDSASFFCTQGNALQLHCGAQSTVVQGAIPKRDLLNLHTCYLLLKVQNSLIKLGLIFIECQDMLWAVTGKLLVPKQIRVWISSAEITGDFCILSFSDGHLGKRLEHRVTLAKTCKREVL